MTDNKPYIDPQILALLEPMWENPGEEFDWDNLSEEEVIAMRAPAAEAILKEPQLGPELPRVLNLEAVGAFGKTSVRLYDPLNIDKPLPALIYLHGGGWCGGSIEDRDNGARLFAAGSNVAVLSVDYALAPEQKFPGPLDDVVAVCRWFRDHGNEFGIDPQQLAIGGDSSGANLALAAALDFRNADEHFIRNLILFYGVYAHDHSTASHQSFGCDDRYTLSSAAMDLCWRMYLANPTQDQDPRSAPLLADMADLPPAYIMCGSLDPLLDDSLQLYTKMQKAGIDVVKRIYQGVPHSFLSFIDKVNLSRQAWAEAADYLRLQTS